LTARFAGRFEVDAQASYRKYSPAILQLREQQRHLQLTKRFREAKATNEAAGRGGSGVQTPLCRGLGDAAGEKMFVGRPKADEGLFDRAALPLGGREASRRFNRRAIN
jgi:hypothetical protein